MIYEGPNWQITNSFNRPATEINFREVKPTAYPAELMTRADAMETDLWNAAVDLKKEEVGDGFAYGNEIRGRKSLWKVDADGAQVGMLMVPGVQFALDTWHPDSGIVDVVPSQYSRSESLKSPEWKRLFTDGGYALPRGAIAPVLWMGTRDDKKNGEIVGTVRGASNKFAYATWGMGGDADDTEVTLDTHLRHNEAKHELNTTEGLGQIVARGIVGDDVLGKDDLVTTALTTQAFADIRTGEKEYLSDVAGFTAIPLGTLGEGLAAYLVEHSVSTLDPASPDWKGNLSAPSTGGLVLVGYHLEQEGRFPRGWTESVVRELNQ
jgi:hypothetical protein